MMKSYRRLKPSKPRAPRLPAVYPILKRWCLWLLHPSRARTTATSLLLTMFYGFLRPGEATGSEFSPPPVRAHLSFANDGSYVTLHLPESKTDIYRLGVDIRIASNGSDLCPVHFLRIIFDGALFKDPSAPLFQHPSGAPFLYSELAFLIHDLCVHNGLDPKLYKPHSIRIGAATTAAVLGFPADVIRTLGRWSSSCYQLYTRMTSERFAAVSSSFASSRPFSLVPSEFGNLLSIPATKISFENIGVIFSRP